MSAVERPARRRFLQHSAAVTIAFSLGPIANALAQPATLPGSLNTNRRLDAWLRDAKALSLKMSNLRDISPVVSFKHDVESEG